MQNDLPALLDRVAAGEEVEIVRDARTVARLVAVTRPEAGPYRCRVRLAGMLEAVGDDGAFTLQLADGQGVKGVLRAGSVEELARQTRQSIVIDGTAVYGPPGEMVVETEAFRPAAPHDAFFSRMPSPPPHWIDLDAMGRRNAAALGEIFGKWPGDETDEQIQAALREMG
jgi:antitoxin (DNA-binding transcriptional repressor) of toxin-antitoxin stability system